MLKPKKYMTFRDWINFVGVTLQLYGLCAMKAANNWMALFTAFIDLSIRRPTASSITSLYRHRGSAWIQKTPLLPRGTSRFWLKKIKITKIHKASRKTYFAVDDARVDLKHTRPDVRVCVMQMFLQYVEEAVAVSFARVIEPITTQDTHKDLPQHLTDCNTHCVALKSRCLSQREDRVVSTTASENTLENVTDYGPQITKDNTHGSQNSKERWVSFLSSAHTRIHHANTQHLHTVSITPSNYSSVTVEE